MPTWGAKLGPDTLNLPSVHTSMPTWGAKLGPDTLNLPSVHHLYARVRSDPEAMKLITCMHAYGLTHRQWNSAVHVTMLVCASVSWLCQLVILSLFLLLSFSPSLSLYVCVFVACVCVCVCVCVIQYHSLHSIYSTLVQLQTTVVSCKVGNGCNTRSCIVSLWDVGSQAYMPSLNP